MYNRQYGEADHTQALENGQLLILFDGTSPSGTAAPRGEVTLTSPLLDFRCVNIYEGKSMVRRLKLFCFFSPPLHSPQFP
jgi:hypothetical protein